MNMEFRDIGEAVEAYVSKRDALSAETKRYNEFEAEAKGELDRISMWLRDKGDELGVDNFKTQYGTAFRSVKTKYQMGDWNEFIQWVKDTENFQCLEKRVAKLATKEIHDATGEIPPGVSYSAEVEFVVRRPTKTSKE